MRVKIFIFIIHDWGHGPVPPFGSASLVLRNQLSCCSFLIGRGSGQKAELSQLLEVKVQLLVDANDGLIILF